MLWGSQRDSQTYLGAGSAWDCDEGGPGTSRVCWGGPPP